MKIYIGSDHAGFSLKEKIKEYLKRKKIPFEDLGTNSKKPVDYPDYAKKVCKKVLKNKNSRGILICGSGTGMVIAANRFKGIRAVAPYDNYSAKMSRKDNNSNVIALRGRFFSHKKALSLLSAWLKTHFRRKKRHKTRIEKLDTLP